MSGWLQRCVRLPRPWEGGGKGPGQLVATAAHDHSPWPRPTGDLCEHAENPCQLQEPCLHGGTCQGTHCLCPPGFSGPRCQQGSVTALASVHLPGVLGLDHDTMGICAHNSTCLSPQALDGAQQSPTGISKAVGATVRICCGKSEKLSRTASSCPRSLGLLFQLPCPLCWSL